jgi:RimJ/RimL family protein N-acetyltransferase
MRLVRHDGPAAFLAVAEPAFAAREAFFSLPLTVARGCRDDPARYSAANWFATAEDADGVAGAALVTPPLQAIVYVPPGPAMAAVADAFDAMGLRPPGVHGPAAAADAFAALWCARRGLRPELTEESRAFELTEVVAAPPASGRMRAAAEADLPLVETWYADFFGESDPFAAGRTPAEQGRCAMREGRLVLWDDGGAVAQAAVVGRTPHGARVGHVYTPPALRRRGYATALVEALSRRLLAEGRRYCSLFADLANPVSNSIYAKIGYRPVGDFRDVEFAEA